MGTKGKVNFKTLAAELRAHIEKQEQVIDENNRQIENIMRMQNKLKFEVEQKKKYPNGAPPDDDEKLADGIRKKTRTIKVINDDGDEETDEEDYYVDVDGKEVQKPPTPKYEPTKTVGNGLRRVLHPFIDTK